MVTVYSLSTGTPFGSCGSITGGYECVDGAIHISVIDGSGCGAKAGAASCTIGDYVTGTSTLECEDQNYEVSDGSGGTCNANDDDEMTCSVTGTSNFASASCDSGCGTVSGTGSCKPKAKP